MRNKLRMHRLQFETKTSLIILNSKSTRKICLDFNPAVCYADRIVDLENELPGYFRLLKDPRTISNPIKYYLNDYFNVAFGTYPHRSSKKDMGKTYLESKLKKIKSQVDFMVNLYCQIPQILLDPDLNAPLIADYVDYSDTQFEENYEFNYSSNCTYVNLTAKIKLIPSTFNHPSLSWLINALGREAIYLVLTRGRAPEHPPDNIARSDYLCDRYSKILDYSTHPIYEIFRKLISLKSLKEIVKYRDYKEALRLWYKMKPTLEESAKSNDGNTHCWWIKGRDYNSIEFFENIVLAGGWPIFGFELKDNWTYRTKYEDVGRVLPEYGGWEKLITSEPNEIKHKLPRNCDIRKSKKLNPHEEFIKLTDKL